jgi:hypothetical protein
MVIAMQVLLLRGIHASLFVEGYTSIRHTRIEGYDVYENRYIILWCPQFTPVMLSRPVISLLGSLVLTLRTCKLRDIL